MARRATSLGPKPSLFVSVFFVFSLFFVFLMQNNPCFPLEKGIFCLFSVFLFLSPLAFFDLPLFLFLFPCLSLFFFSFFIPSCLCFLLSFGSLFWSLSLFFFILWFSFMKGTTSKYSIASSSSSISSLFLVSCLFLFQVPVSYLCSFLILSYVFVQHQGFSFPNKQLKKNTHTFFGQKGGCNKTIFLYQPVFWRMSKVIVFFGRFFVWLFFLAIFG